MSNFAFLPDAFRTIADAARRAEGHIMGDPRAACFHTRFTLEAVVHWLYRHDAGLRMPYDNSLGALLHEPTLQNLLPQAVFQKARVIQKVGNQAVHNQRPIRRYDALQVVRELHHICYWLVRTYAPDAAQRASAWQDGRVPKALPAGEVVPRQELEVLEAKLAEQNQAALKEQQQRDALDVELQELRRQLADIRAQAEVTPDAHNYSEAATRHYLIDVELKRAGWPLDKHRDREFAVTGMPNAKGLGYIDYVLWGDDGKPLAVVEAKKTTVDPAVGKQQAKLYADCLQQVHGRRPIIFFTNGYATWLWDDLAYPPRQVAGFYKKDELQRLIVRRTQQSKLDVAQIKDAIVERYYQKRAIGSIFSQFTQARRKALLVMATGTFIEERFNHHYPHYKGHFARIIDHYAKYPQSLIDDFSRKNKAPHIAISVDMLDTGIDVPEAANLVFFKPVYSRIKFWQMIGRGTRLCPGLFGPGEDKEDFRVFDFCFNFDFFRENPEGIETGGGVPLGTRLFRARVQLLGHLQHIPDLDPEGHLREGLSTGLYEEVSAMNRENFIVRMRLEAVEKFQKRDAWDTLSEDDREVLQREVATLPSELTSDDIEARLFDLTALRMQLALAESDINTLERSRQKVVEIAMLLEEKAAIPAVKAQLGYLAALQDTGFWEELSLAQLEEMRLRLRHLVTFLDKKKRTVVYTDFQDEVLGVRTEEVFHMPKMTGAQYEKKLRDYLRSHFDHLVIHRLRRIQPLTVTDLQGLEQTLAEIGANDGRTLLGNLLARSGAPSLLWFVRSLVGLDRSAAQSAFSRFLNDRSLTGSQIRFVETVIDQLTARGVMEASALYEPPFSNLHAGGPDALFAGKDTVIEGIFAALESLRPDHQAVAG